MASIHPYKTKKGERRYEVRYRDGDGRQRSRAFTAHKDAHTFKSRSSANGSPTAGSTPTRSEAGACSPRARSVNGSAPATRPGGRAMASIRPYRTPSGQRRYEVRYRDGDERQRSRAFTARKDAQAFRLDVERRRQAGMLYQAAPERFDDYARAWLARYERGAAGRVRPRPGTAAMTRQVFAKLAPLNELPLERVRASLVEDFIAELAGRTPRRAEMALALLKRILRSAEARGQVVDPAVFHVRVARPEEREPRFLTWDEAEEVRSWMPEHVCRVVPIGILTLLRRGELLGLRDGDIDSEDGAITVVSQAQGGRRAR